MIKRILFILVAVSTLVLFTQSCTIKLNGASTQGLKTINVGYFENNAQLVVGNLSQNFTEALKSRIRTTTSLAIVQGEADASLTGSITGYSIEPVSVQATNNNVAPIAGANRLTITVSVIYTNKANKKNNFTQSFPAFADFTGDIANQEQNLIATITKQLTEDILTELLLIGKAIRSFNLVDQYLNNRQTEVLWNLLAEPADNGQSYVSNLQSLVAEFPQSGLLHALLSHAEKGHNVARAAAYVNPKALYTLINSPESLAAVSQGQIVWPLAEAKPDAKDLEDTGLLRDEEVLHPADFDNTIVEENSNSTEQEAIEEIVERITISEDAYLENESVEPIGIVTENEPIVNNAILWGHRHDAEATEDIEQVAQQLDAAPHYQDLDSTEPVHRSVYEESVIEDEIIEYGPLADEAELFPEDEKSEAQAPGVEVHNDEQLTETASFALTEPPHGIEDEVFDEIVGIESIRFAHNPKSVETVIPDIELPIMDEEASRLVSPEPPSEPVVQKERHLNMDDEAEKLIVGNIAATDYFVFDRAFTERKPAETAETGNGLSDREMAAAPAAETNDISKYDDDSLPYTFLWWLNKTRKEHAGVYQPFKLDTTQAIRQHGADELQQQYYENIFHLNSVEELDRSTALPAVEFDSKRKEDRIIKKFIIEEPHINAPSSDKLDNENKAKKSAEDQDELVTETLARIYTDQMLYHKAINTYKKLMLKFPEKSRYFADQIEQLERKTN